MKEIYIAGGCFWGVEAFFKQLDGIKKTKVGYANSLIPNPSYEDVCTGRTNAVEAVYLAYNPQVASLPQIIEFLFRIIDPTSLNKQGGDEGTQYRTGIYYVDEKDGQVIDEVLDSFEENYDKPIVVEYKKLLNFYEAESYHQDYLAKNPNGYCHINLGLVTKEEKKINKRVFYNEVLDKAAALFNEKSPSLSILANITSLIKEHFERVSWIGVYLDDGKRLILGPFQGKVACETIGYDRGVCGACYSSAESLIVPDVHRFPGHIACDDLTKSEIVLPIFDYNDHIVGVLDLDSYRYDNFDEEDERYLKILLNTVRKYLNKKDLI